MPDLKARSRLTGYRSSSPSDDDDDDDVPVRPGLSREARLARDLNFYDRYDPVKFQETPFTLAQIAAGRRANSGNTSSPEETPGPSSLTAHLNIPTSKKTAPKVNKPVVTQPRKIGGSIQPANPDPGGRNDINRFPAVTEEPVNKNKPKPKRDNIGGWQVKGANITLVKKKDDSKSAKGKGKAKAPAKPKATASKKKKDEDNEKITFTRIPAGAGPSSSFPIVQGLQKQRDKQSSKAQIDPFPLDVSDTSDEVPEIDWDLLLGYKKAPDAAEQETLKQEPETETIPIGELVTRNDIKMESKDKHISNKAKKHPVKRGSRSKKQQLKLNPQQDQAHQVKEFENEPKACKDPPAIASETKRAVNEALTLTPVQETHENALPSQASNADARSEDPPSDNDEPVDSAIKAQREKLRDFRGMLQKQHALHQQERSRSQSLPRSVADDVYDNIPVKPITAAIAHASRYRPPSEADQTYTGTTRVPSTYSYPKQDPDMSIETPPTITRVSVPSASKHWRTSSSDLPYSSPLERANHISRIHQPSPRRLRQVGGERVETLENMVEPAQTWIREGRQHMEELPVSQHLHDRREVADRSYQGIPQVQDHDHDRDYHSQAHRNDYNRVASDHEQRYQMLQISPPAYEPYYPIHMPDAQGHRQHRKRILSPDSPPPVVQKRPRPPPVVRNSPLRSAYRDGSASPEWSTLKPNSKKSIVAPSPINRSSGTFRLPMSKILAGDIGSSASKPSSVHSTRANWFKPSPRVPEIPMAAAQVTRRHFDRRFDINDEQGRFRDQVRRSMGYPQPGPQYTQQPIHQGIPPFEEADNCQDQDQNESSRSRQYSYQEQSSYRLEKGEEDWRKAWERPSHQGSLTKYAYTP